MTNQVRKILVRYRVENLGVLINLARMLNHGRLAGTGRMIILPVDYAFEHGPARIFAPSPRPTIRPTISSSPSTPV